MTYTDKEKAKLVGTFIEEGRNYKSFTTRIRRDAKNGRASVPDNKSIKKWTKQFEMKGSIQDLRGKNQPKRVRTEANIERVRKHFEKHPHDSVRRNGLQLKKSTVHRILKEDLQWHPYKIQMLQKLRNQDHASR
jgi:hypothetical protein